MVLGLGAGDIERPCLEWEPYVEPLRLRMFEIRRQAAEAGLEGEEEPSHPHQGKGYEGVAQNMAA